MIKSLMAAAMPVASRTEVQMSPYEERIARVLSDYRDGLLDSLEDAVEAIVAIVESVR